MTKGFFEKYGHRIFEAGPGNEKITEMRHVLTGKYDAESGLDKFCVLDGFWALEKAAAAGLFIKTFVLCPELLESGEAFALAEKILPLAGDTLSVSKKTFLRISLQDGPCGLGALAGLPEYSPADLMGQRLLIVLDGLETPGNSGTIFRSAEGAGAGGIITVNRKFRRNHPKLVKAGMGASFLVPEADVSSPADCRELLLKNGYTVCLADTAAKRDYFETEYSFPAALVVGSERYGISGEWYKGEHTLVKIPMRGMSDSLNAGVAASILLYDMANRGGARPGRKQ